jgi:hypothetical protein
LFDIPFDFARFAKFHPPYFGQIDSVSLNFDALRIAEAVMDSFALKIWEPRLSPFLDISKEVFKSAVQVL